ncbi:MAG: hypothetical protein WD059_02115 [Balneolaceae bacterium]
MKSMLIISMLFTFWEQDIFAQHIEIKRSHAIADIAPQFNHQPAVGTLNVVAIMVEFQPDDNRLTSGTGIFGDGGLPYLENQPDFTIEPLPHDQNYFESHLEFAKNYYEKSSNDQLTIDYQVLPEVYRLPKQMEEYSPTGETFTNEKLAELTRDAWKQVEENGGFNAAGLDPEHTAFIIFHAGVGRDIELTGTNLDITPYDIPSIYLRKSDLQDLTDEPSFDGFPVNDGTFRITNSMILPRTESRRGLDIQDNEFVFPLSINGLVIASIGSHLGLPDLFNTETGDPAIGRFGLMDGAGFFSYHGLLPPEPSAWEKIYLGWETPFLIDVNTTGDITLPATSLNQPNSIAKYELSSSEYFLVENRHRDPDSTGITITTRRPDGSEVQQTFTNDDVEFVFQEAGFDSLLEAGVFVDADNFDFSLPGGLDIGEDGEEDTEDDRFLNGGMLIWHIDEAMIQSQLQAGRVNTDRSRRGVDLEEADGAQDIGPGIPGALDNSAAFGTAFDFWWSGNNYRVIAESGSETQLYENRFGPDTKPDNRSNSGSSSFFELYDFSDNLPVASFKIRRAEQDELIYEPVFSISYSTLYFAPPNLFTPENSYWDYYPLSLGIYEAASDTLLVVPGASTVHFYDHINPKPRHIRLIGTSSNQQPFIGEDMVFATNPADQTQINLSSRSLDEEGHLTTNWGDTVQANNAFLSSQSGDTLFADFTDNAWLLEDGTEVSNPSSFDFTSEKVNGKYAAISGSTVIFIGDNLPDFTSNSQNRLFAGTIKTNTSLFYYIFEDNAFTLVNPEKDDPFLTLFEEESAEWPAIVDGLNIYRINSAESSIEGYNLNGGLLNNMPIKSPDDIQFIGTPLIADITGDNIQDIIVVGQDEVSLNIYGYETNGSVIEGFPLYVGNVTDKQTQPIHPVFYGDILYAVSHNADMKAWRFKHFTSSQWPTRYGEKTNNKVSAEVEFQDSPHNTFSVLNKTETYNWPNPANDLTNIRFEVARPGGTVEVKVITVSGRVIFEEKVESAGGFPQEIQVQTSGWGSGGYIALVKATVDGKTETKLVKIGVVH